MEPGRPVGTAPGCSSESMSVHRVTGTGRVQSLEAGVRKDRARQGTARPHQRPVVASAKSGAVNLRVSQAEPAEPRAPAGPSLAAAGRAAACASQPRAGAPWRRRRPAAVTDCASAARLSPTRAGGAPLLLCPGAPRPRARLTRITQFVISSWHDSDLTRMTDWGPRDSGPPDSDHSRPRCSARPGARLTRITESDSAIRHDLRSDDRTDHHQWGPRDSLGPPDQVRITVALTAPGARLTRITVANVALSALRPGPRARLTRITQSVR